MLNRKPGSSVCAGWSWSKIDAIASESRDRAGADSGYPVLSVTKHRGILPAAEYFKKRVHGEDLSRYKVVRRGQLAYATIHLDEGSVGLLSNLDAGLVSPMYTVFEVNGEVDPEYLLLVLKSSRSQELFHKLGQGTVNRRAAISFAALSELFICHPPLSEQRKITSIVASVDQVIAKTESVISGLKNAKRHLVIKLFSPETSDTDNHKWETLPLKSLLESGPDNGLYRPQSAYGQGAPIIRINDFSNGEDLGGSRFQRVSLPAGLVEKFSLGYSDIIINRVNSLSHIAKVAFVGKLSEPTVFESNMMRIRINKENIFPRFVFHFLSSPLVRDYFRRRAKKAVAQASVNQKDILELPVPIPPCKDQLSISETIDSISECINAEARLLRCLKEVRAALSAALLSGKISVGPDEVIL